MSEPTTEHSYNDCDCVPGHHCDCWDRAAEVTDGLSKHECPNCGYQDWPCTALTEARAAVLREVPEALSRGLAPLTTSHVFPNDTLTTKEAAVFAMTVGYIRRHGAERLLEVLAATDRRLEAET